MSTVLPGEICSGLLVHLYCQKLKDNGGWSNEILFKESQHKFLLTILKIVRNVDCNWLQLQEKVRVSCPEGVYKAFVKEVRALNTEDSLLNILKTFEDVVAERTIEEQTNSIKRTSILGLFVRKLVLKLKKLNFVEVYQLLKDILEYSTSSVENLQDQSTQSMDLSCVDENTSNVSVDENKENVSYFSNFHRVSQSESDFKKADLEQEKFASKRSVYKFIEKHVNLLENFAFEAPKPNVLQEKIEQVRRLHPRITDVYYLSFLNYLRVSEVNKAARMLSLYFDNKDFQNQPSNDDMSEQEKHLTMFKRFRYGALNLGMMYCRCQEYEQALKVLKEAVCVAQETNDEVCLKYAMFWIHVVNEKTGNLNYPMMETHCDNLIKELYKEDESVIDSIQDIDCFAIQRYMEISAFRGFRSPANLLSIVSRIIVSNSKVSDSALLSRSALLDFYGFKLLSIYNLQLPLQTMTLSRNKKRRVSEENWNIGIMQLTLHFIAMGHLDEGRSVQELLWKDVFHPSCHIQKQLMFNRSITERELDNAVAIAESNTNYFERLYSLAVIDVTRGDYNSAFQRITEFRSRKKHNSKKEVMESSKNISPKLEIQISLLLIELKLCSSNPSQAIDDILELWSTIVSLKLYAFFIDVHMCLARYNIKSRLINKALKLIDNVFILTLANGTPYQQGLIYFLRARCLMEQACKLKILEQKNESKADTMEKLCIVLEHFKKSLIFFERINAKARIRDVFGELSVVYHELGIPHERNWYATKFRMLNEELKNHSEALLF